MKQHRIHLILFVIIPLLGAPDSSLGRTTSLTGYCSIREGFDSNIDREATDEQAGWATTISPTIELTSKGSSDRLSFSYSPGFTFDHKKDDQETDHHLVLSGDKDFSSRLHAAFSESFVRSNATFIELVPIETETSRLLAESKRKERLWTNSFSIRTEYEYAAESIFTLGYANHILEYNETLRNNYIRHNPQTSISYRFNPQWSTKLSYDYVIGDFDLSEDLTRHNSGLQLTYNLSPRTSFSTNYNFLLTDYDGNREDYKTQVGTVGLAHEIDPRTNISTAVGYTYADRGTTTDDAINYSIRLSRELARGLISLTGSGGHDDRQFDGDNNGLARFWSFGGRLRYQLAEKVAGDLYGSIRDDTFIELQQNDEKTYGGGGGLSFSFWRWLSLSLRYAYLEVDAENNSDDYQDHRLFAELKFAKELWRQ